jgi:ferredoxin--NADP+ reductase
VPFDERSAVIPNDGGRVTDPSSGAQLPGEYVVGWIKRGPSGVIGTNKKDAQETVDAMFADLAAGNGHPAGGSHRPEQPDRAGIEALLRERQPQLVSYEGWEAIDRHERALGEAAGRPRVKLTSIEEMLRIAAAEGP